MVAALVAGMVAGILAVAPVGLTLVAVPVAGTLVAALVVVTWAAAEAVAGGTSMWTALVFLLGFETGLLTAIAAVNLKRLRGQVVTHEPLE